ncbi:MAG: glycosyltransferase [Oscillospiraceae bacterium]|nr:glycosyltransferase [Oscillospiraceae bacterium]MDD4367937.1 glycosyltransferase [Oscillospiraceae bacterium]
MQRLLIILTMVYPNSWKDRFVEDELPYLDTQFDRILVCPVNAVGREPDHGRYPGRVKILTTNRRGRVAARGRDICYAGFSAFNQRPDQQAERRRLGNSLKKRLFLAYFDGRCAQACHDLKPAILAASATASSVTLYSYWLTAAARTAMLLADVLSSRYPRLKINLYSRGHGYDVYEYANSLNYLPYRQALLARFAGIFVCSQNGVDYMKSQYKDKYDLSHIYLGRLAIPDPLTQAAVRAASLPPALAVLAQPAELQPDLTIVTCSRAESEKRLNLLLAALVLLQQQSSLRLTWVHLGAGPLLDSLRAAATSLSPQIQTAFPGAIRHDVLLKYYLAQKPDLFINVSEREGVPVSIMEALACAIPAFATSVGGTPELVRAGQGGWLWPADVTAARIAQDLIAYAGRSLTQRRQDRQLARRRWQNFASTDQYYPELAGILAGRIRPHNVPLFTSEDESL